MRILSLGSALKLKELIQYFPDLNYEFSSWINEKLMYCIVQSITSSEDRKVVTIKLRGVKDLDELELHFPGDYCKQKIVKVESHGNTIEYEECNWSPNITQLWEGAFGIGDACIVPVLQNDIGINILGGMYMIAYVFGMMARYFPSAWVDLQRGGQGDKIYPFSNQIFDFINLRFPMQVLDFLRSPYEFENRSLMKESSAI